MTSQAASRKTNTAEASLPAPLPPVNFDEKLILTLAVECSFISRIVHLQEQYSPTKVTVR